MFSLLVGLIIKQQSSPSYYNYMKSCTLAPDFQLAYVSLPLAAHEAISKVVSGVSEGPATLT